MASPFPGIDPFLEGCGLWLDFHARFIIYWCDALADELPDSYQARISERVNLVDVTESRIREIYPDVAAVVDESRRSYQPGESGVATLAPVRIPHLIESESRETYIEVVRLEDQKLVTVLELLSPANKQGGDRALYLDKRNRLLLQDVHLFELDLLLGGRRLPHGKPLPSDHYYAFLSRAEERFDCEVYHWSLRDRLPTLPVPLLAPDPDVLLDYAAIFATTYERGRYARAIDYRRELDLSAQPEDKQWIASLLKDKRG